MRTRRVSARDVRLTESDLHLLSAALGLYQQAMEKASHLAYGLTTDKQRSRMIERGIDAVDLRNRLFKQWETPR